MVEFKKLRESDLEMVLRWRIKESVSRYLFTRVQNDLDQQRQWFKKVSSDPGYRYWVIHYQNKPIGLFNLCNLDFQNKRTNAGYYIGEDEYRQLGGIIPPYFYNYIFRHIKLNKVYGEVVDQNEILRIHQLHGYRLVGVLKKHLVKDNECVDVHIVELLAEDWLKQKRYDKYVAKFEE